MTKKKKDDSEDKAHFIVLVRLGGSMPWSRPFVVRARSLREAYLHVMQESPDMFQNPSITLEGYIVGLEPLPEAKRIARSWWMLGQTTAGNDAMEAAREFESMWREHGAIDVNTEEDES